MLGYLFVILTGYYAIASIRSSIKWIELSDDDAIDKWANEHPYHYFLKEAKVWRNDPTGTGWIGGSISAISWIVAFAILLADFSLYATPLFLGASVYGIVAFSYWLHTKNYFANWQITRLWQKTKVWWQSRVPEEIRQAKDLQAKLQKTITAKKKSSLKTLLRKVDIFVQKELPRLLNLRAELQKDVVEAKEIIQREKANGLCEGEGKLMAESEEGLKILESRLEKTKKKIQYALAFLDHMIIRVEVITSSDSEESRNEIAEIQEELDIMIKAHEEVGNIFKEIEKNPLEDDSQEKTEIFQSEKVLTA
jgi:hypothetical protein